MHARAKPVDDEDMFRDEVGTPDLVRLIEFTGILTCNADVRSKPAKDNLHSVPVVCVHLKSTRETQTHTCRADLAFTDSTRKDAEALAKTLTKGRQVTVYTPVTDMCLVFPHATFIEVHQEPTSP